MKKRFKKVLSAVLVCALLITGIAATSLMSVAAAGFSASGGWNETAYAEWSANTVDGTNVYIRRTGQSNYTQVDSELIRMINNDTARVDVPGLLGNTQYDIRVVPASGSEITGTVTTLAHDRSGYAHFNYQEGVGAYNNDGTLKDNAIVVYVTEANKNTVTIPGYTGTGIGWILNNNPALMGEITSQHPLVIRIIGRVTAPDGLTGYNSTVNGGTKGDNGNMAIIKNVKNITIEGIGYDAQIYGWGISYSHMAIHENGGKNYEIRNITFDDYPEDAVGVQGEMAGNQLTAPIERVWIHNNTFLSGYCANPAESDKAEGDGSCDFKRGLYYTLSYNKFEDCKKTNLIGASDDNLQYHLTLHHNWWEDCGARMPLVRQANTHIYNNYYLRTVDKGQDARANAYVFSEANYFESCKRPFETNSGAVIKSFGDVLYDCQLEPSANVVFVTDREQPVPNNNRYPDFDTNTNIFYFAHHETDAYVTDAITAKSEVIAYSGVMKRVPDSPVRQTVFSETPANAVTLPYTIDFANSPGVTMNTGRTVLNNVIFKLTKSYNGSGSTGNVTVKKEGALFKVNGNATVTIKDGGSSYSIVLVDSDGIVWAAPSKNGTATADIPAGVYAVQAGNTQKEAKIVSISIVGRGEQPTEIPTEMPTQRPTETPTEIPTEIPTQRPTETQTQPPAGSTLVLNASNSYPSNVTISATEIKNGFGILANSSNTVAVDANNKSIDGFSFTRRIKLSGAGNADYRSIGFKTTAASTVTIYAMSSNSSESRQFEMVDFNTGTVVDSVSNLGGSSVSKVTFNAPKAGIYYVRSVISGVNVYYISVTNGAALTLQDLEGGEIPTERPTQQPTQTPTQAPAAIVHNFTTNGKTSSFFAITGNLSTSYGTVNYNSLTLTQCLKIESSTNITFSVTKDSTLTLVFPDSFSGKIKVDGTNYTAQSGRVNVSLGAGTHTITKADVAQLFYMIVN